ncbi:MAG: extracellular solute-binding protein [Chloroflexi bacterium]|nr:extracellular solute-binding protein [Chloroflexota bacterium]
MARGAAAAGGGLLAACSLPGGGSKESAPPAPGKLSGTIEFWHAWTTRQPVLRPYLDQFERQHPGVKVEDIDANNIGGRMKLITAILAGSPPDAFHMFADFQPDLVPAKVLRDLMPYVRRDKVDLKTFYDSEIKAHTFQGELLALPVVVTTNAHFIVWNKELLRAAGLNPDEGPKTWSQAQEMVLKLTRRAGDEIQQLGLDPGAPPGNGIPTNQFIRWLYHNGGKLMTDDGKKVAFNDQAGLETLEWLQQVISRQGTFAAFRKVSGLNPFYNGQVAMTVQQDNIGSGIRVHPQGKTMSWGIGLLPVNDRNPKAKVATPAMSGHGYGVPRDAKYPEGGWTLTKYLTTSDAACGFLVKDQGRFVPLKRCADIPEVKDQPESKVFAAGAQAGVVVPRTSANVEIAKILSVRIQEMFEGKASPKAALEAAAHDAQIELDKAIVLPS